jgi:hypothetical protein
VARALRCAGATAGLAVLFVVAVVAAGDAARGALVGHPRYRTPFAAIECTAPPGLSNADFLDEVQYLGRLPDRVDSLQPDLETILRAAFAAHPRVASVDAVGRPGPGRIEVRLTFRPVPPAADDSDDGPHRAASTIRNTIDATANPSTM